VTGGTFCGVSDHAAQTHDAAFEGQVIEIERWMIDRGVPHLVDRHSDSVLVDAWSRAVPLLIAAYILLGLNALDLRNWTVVQNLTAAAAIVVILIATWAVSNRLRRRPTFAQPTRVGPAELAVFLIGPVLPGVAFGQYRDAVETLVLGGVLLALIYVWSSYGVSALLRWGARRSGGQLTGLGPLVARALPLLLLFNTFLFVNAEVWEMAGTLDGAAFVVVVLMFFLLGAGFVVIRVPGFIVAENHFESWNDIAGHVLDTPAASVALPPGGPTLDPLGPRQRFNIGLIVLFGQALQITLVVAALVGFFVFFGFMAIGPQTILNWTGLTTIEPLAEVTFGSRTLVLSEPLIRVAIFLGGFSGMYFTVLLTTDETYRNEFTDDVGSEIRQVLAVRCAYHVARHTHPAVPVGMAVLDDPPTGEPVP
jgi:hypothetical protein